MNNQRPIFIVGCPRSGTTLLQSMLAAHSTITSFPESHLLLVTSRSRRGRWLRKLGLVALEMRQRLHQFLHEIGHPELLPPMTYRLQAFIRQFAQMLEQLTVAQEKTIMCAAHHNVAPQLIAAHETWKSGVLTPLHMVKHDKFKRLFTQEQQRVIGAQLVSPAPDIACDDCRKVSGIPL